MMKFLSVDNTHVPASFEIEFEGQPRVARIVIRDAGKFAVLRTLNSISRFRAVPVAVVTRNGASQDVLVNGFVTHSLDSKPLTIYVRNFATLNNEHHHKMSQASGSGST